MPAWTASVIDETVANGSYRNASSTAAAGENTKDWTLELVAVLVSNVDEAKAFYTDRLGFRVDHDTVISAEERLVQLTPPGSACSISIGTIRPRRAAL